MKEHRKIIEDILKHPRDYFGHLSGETHCKIDSALKSLLAEVDGNTLYNALCKQLISRIIEAESNCDPPSDIDLRLASIINERDYLKQELAKQTNLPNSEG